MKLATLVDAVIEQFGNRHFRLNEVCAELTTRTRAEIRDNLQMRVRHGTLIERQAQDWSGVVYCVRDAADKAENRFKVSPALIRTMQNLGRERAPTGAVLARIQSLGESD